MATSAFEQGPDYVQSLARGLFAGAAVGVSHLVQSTRAGASYGFALIFFVVLANAMAWLIQYLSAKLGVTTGESLPGLLGRRMRSRACRWAWSRSRSTCS